MRRASHYFIACLLSFLATFTTASEKVVLQLKWEHEFQFAGYYAALWQGFYESEGLDVEIRPVSRADGSTVSPSKELLAGKVDFAIGATDILILRDQGEDVVALASIFQRSPNALFSLEGTPINSVGQLAKLKIGSSTDYTSDEIKTLFNEHGFGSNNVDINYLTPTINALIEGKVDVIATYGVSLMYAAEEKGVNLNHLLLSDHGLQFYGDTLYTHQSVIDSRPDVVEKFIRATVRGWEYALQNKTTVAEKIAKELPRYLFTYDDLTAYNLRFAESIDEYMAYPISAVGNINPQRWQNIHQQLKAAGLISNDWDSGVIINESLLNTPPQSGVSVLIIFICSTLILILLAIFFLRREVTLWMPCFFLVFAIILIENFIEKSLREAHYQQVRLDTSEELNVVSAKLSGVLNNSMSLIAATAAHIAAEPDIDQADFDRFAAPLLKKEPLFVNLGVAKDFVVNMISPIAGNEAVLGFDYLKSNAYHDEVLQVKRTNTHFITDPVELIQGGNAFIGRAAVYTESKTGEPVFWGIVSGPIDSHGVYKKAGLLSDKLGINIAIASRNNLGNKGDVFFGDEDIIADHKSLKTTLLVGDTRWVLAAAPKEGWYQATRDIWGLRFTTVIFGVLLLLFVAFRHRQLIQSKAYEEQLRQSEKLLSDVGELALIGPWQINRHGQIINWHRQTSKVLGLSYPVVGDLIERLASVFTVDQLQKLKQCLDSAHSNGESFDIELCREDKHKNIRWLRFIGNVVIRQGQIHELLGAVQDISERKHSHELIQYQASYDNLTGLPNRLLLNDNLEKNIAKASRDNNKLAVLFVDLDNFKPVNDSLGHKAGDKVLKEVARRLKSCIRASDTVARYSGDEFIILLQDVDDGSGSLPVAENVIHEMNQPFNIDGREVFCGASVGIAIYPEDGKTGEALISNADQAMYVAKESGRNNWHYFTDEMQQQSEKRQRLHSKLVSAISKKELTVHYQPIMDLSTGQITKCESLVRWFEEDGSQVSTEEFIGLAEEMGVINDIDFYVLEQAGRELYELAQQQQQDVGLSINVSPRIFSAKDKSLSRWISLIIEVAEKIDVTVEITERVLTQDSRKALQALTQLKEAGISIAIDDFGTGYSSLSYLTKFPIDYIKIDRSFIANIGISESDETLTETVIGLANKLSMRVVAEGIETQQQLDFLKDLGCDYAQGYLLGKPQVLSEFAKQFANSGEENLAQVS